MRRPKVKPSSWLGDSEQSKYFTQGCDDLLVTTDHKPLVKILADRTLDEMRSLKPGAHTNDFAPIHRRRALKLGHASLATVFRPGRLTSQQIPQENLESPLLRYQPITTAVITEACLNTRWHHGAYTSAALRESLGVDRVVV